MPTLRLFWDENRQQESNKESNKWGSFFKILSNTWAWHEKSIAYKKACIEMVTLVHLPWPIATPSVRDRLQNTSNSAISLAVNNVIPLPIGPSKIRSCITWAREPGRVHPSSRRTDTDGLPRQEVCQWICLSLETIPQDETDATDNRI